MAWKADTYDRAIDAAEKYYDEVLVKLGMFPGELRKLRPDREVAILALAIEGVKEIRKKFPEDTYDENAANVLNNYGTPKDGEPIARGNFTAKDVLSSDNGAVLRSRFERGGGILDYTQAVKSLICDIIVGGAGAQENCSSDGGK